jgi:hypothetical protein
VPKQQPRIIACLAALLGAVVALSCLTAVAAASPRAHVQAHRHARPHSHTHPRSHAGPHRTTVRARRDSLAGGVASEYSQLTSEIVAGYSSSPERHYTNGLWENGDPSCWYCNVGPAVGAAYLANTQPAMLRVAVDSFNRAISEQRLANGSFSGPSPAIVSAAFGMMLGLSYVRLEPQLDATTRSRWQSTLAGIADFLISDHDVTWYANGNINASYAGALYFAWRATGAQKYQDAYNAELQFMVAPTGHLWEGFGLIITQQPTNADGSDGRGFLTEGSPPGWDPEYSHLQLDFLSTLYSASGDPRVLRLLNLILNQELTRVDTTTFALNALGGSRKNEMMVFTSAVLPLLVVDGKRPDLAALLPAAFARLSSEYHATLKYTQHNYYRGVALWLAPILLATSGVPTSSVPVVASGVSGAPTTALPTAQTRRVSVSRPSAPAPNVNIGSAVPQVSPGVLHASRLQLVPGLEIPGAEYAFVTPSVLTGGVVASHNEQARLAFAAFVCTHACTLSIRPLLVIHSRGANTPVVVQTNLKAIRSVLRAGQAYVSRVSVPRSAALAASGGHATFVRLRIALLRHGSPSQARSYMFKLAG